MFSRVLLTSALSALVSCLCTWTVCRGLYLSPCPKISCPRCTAVAATTPEACRDEGVLLEPQNLTAPAELPPAFRPASVPQRAALAVRPLQHVCPERRRPHTKHRESFGLQTFEFSPAKCKHGKPAAQLVTILVLLWGNVPALGTLAGSLSRLSRLHGGVQVLVLTNHTPLPGPPPGVQFQRLQHPVGDAIRAAVASIPTPYTLLAPDLQPIADPRDLDLLRLLRVAERYGAAAVGGSVRTADAGRWHLPCMQSALRRFTLRQQYGYDSSVEDCVACDAVLGPFLAPTSALRNGIDPALHIDSVTDWFLQLSTVEPRLPVLACPDVMFPISGDPSLLAAADFIGLSSKWGISRWVLPSHAELWFGCPGPPGHVLPADRWSPRGGPSVGSNTVSEYLERGLTITPCAEAALARYTHAVVAGCAAVGANCAVHSGTALGALKFGGILPWDNDGDIAFRVPGSTPETSIHSSLAPILLKSDLLLRFKRGVPYRVSELTNGSSYHGLTLDLHFPNRREQQEEWPRGFTRIRLAGQWVNTTYNPARYYRDYYGGGILRHAMLATYAKGAAYAACRPPSPRLRHGCANTFAADGNLQFRNWVLAD